MKYTSVANLTFLPALPRVIRRNVKSKSHTRIIWMLVSLWFRRLYESVLQNDTNVGTGTLVNSEMANFIYRRQFTVEWGHCDPAGIVFNSRFFEFFDRNAWLLFERALGVVPSDFTKVFGITGIPLVDAKASFLKPAKFNDVAEIASEVSEFRRSSFDVQHRIFIDSRLAVEGSETRVWAGRDPGDPLKLKSIPIPAAVIERFRAA
jgi:4-hydroxybenzoyl-CoA thioesterase